MKLATMAQHIKQKIIEKKHAMWMGPQESVFDLHSPYRESGKRKLAHPFPAMGYFHWNIQWTNVAIHNTQTFSSPLKT